jgi:hypothetical protein
MALPPLVDPKESAGEAAAWPVQRPLIDQAIVFADTYLGLTVQGGGTEQRLAANDRVRLSHIIRAMSWVESKHGTDTSAPKNFPARDPLQSGDPGNSWWKELIGLAKPPSKFQIRLSPPAKDPFKTIDADKLNDDAIASGLLPALAKLSALKDRSIGHRDPGFNATMSYCWGAIYFCQKTNSAGGNTYQFANLSRSNLLDGAQRYNGTGDLKYRARVDAALALFGGLP